MTCDRCVGPLPSISGHWVRWGGGRDARGDAGEARLCSPCYELALWISVIVGFDLEELC